MITGVSFEFCRGSKYAIYHVYDSDFEPVEIAIPIEGTHNNPYICECVRAIINCYEMKQLNVPANVVLWLTKTYPDDGPRYINEYKKHIPEYSKYAEDVEKYLMLM